MTEVERYARMICKALHNVDPDERAATGVPMSFGMCYILPRAEYTIPLWRLYEPAAREIVNDIERKKETGE